VNSRIVAAGGGGNVSKGGSGKPSRSQEEIALVFDRNKGAIYALYGARCAIRPTCRANLCSSSQSPRPAK
jgi:protein TonB